MREDDVAGREEKIGMVWYVCQLEIQFRKQERTTHPPTSNKKFSGVTSVEANPPASAKASTMRKLSCF